MVRMPYDRSELFARLRHLPKFLFQVADLVTQTSRKLELQLFGGGMHLLGQLSNEIRDLKKELRQMTEASK